MLKKKDQFAMFALLMVALVGCETVKNEPPVEGQPISKERSTALISSALSDVQASITEDGVGNLPPTAIAGQLMPPPNYSGKAAIAEQRFDLSVNNVSAKALFLGLVKDTNYNIVVHPEVEGSISLDLQKITVPEVMAIIESVYGYPVSRQGNLYQVMPGGLRTEIFKINYLDIRRNGSSETRVSSGSVSDSDVGGASNSNGGNSSSQDQNSSGGGAGGNLIGTQIITSGQSDFWGQLSSNLQMLINSESQSRVVVNPESGIVIVKAMPRQMDIVRDYLKSAELIMRRQVILEAKILEVTLSEAFQSGINWTAIGNPGINKTIVASQGSGALANIGAPGFAAIPGATGIPLANSSKSIFGLSLSLNDFTGIIDLLETQGSVQVLSSPRISTVNNQKAVIKVGTDEFFVTEVTNTVTTNSAASTSVPSVQLTPFFSGISLDVTPQISNDGSIILHVHPTVSEVQEQQRSFNIGTDNFNLPLAQSTVRESDSIIYAKDNQVVVLGGLIQTVSKDADAGTPWISKVPLLGNAFKQKDQSMIKRELVILLRPKVLTHEVSAESIDDSLERVRGLRYQIGGELR
jgi:MSHA biogenesis protein MshL